MKPVFYSLHAKCETWHHFATAPWIAECSSVPCYADSSPVWIYHSSMLFL
uniref:Uncharacterized protein n=1 Tax=Aegilops tauschii subsp. strangulata TaxID=200361 RepID=A0A452ZUB8_AEGTS